MRTLKSATLLLGLSAAVAWFTQAPAQSQQSCGFGIVTAPVPCPGFAAPEAGAAIELTLVPTGAPAPSGLITFDSPMPDMYSVKAGFIPQNVTGQYQYNLTLADLSERFSRVAFTTNVQAALEGVKFQKQVCDTGYGVGDCRTFALDNTATLGLQDLGFLSRKIYVTDTYTATNLTSQVSDITNTFEAVPGPLPVLGAGAAFGFSRKLRKRIKSAG
jgi:hypothetical protein